MLLCFPTISNSNGNYVSMCDMTSINRTQHGSPIASIGYITAYMYIGLHV